MDYKKTINRRFLVESLEALLTDEFDAKEVAYMEDAEIIQRIVDGANWHHTRESRKDAYDMSLHKQISELKWRISCIVDDVSYILDKTKHINIDYNLRQLVDTAISNIEVASELENKECLNWKVNGNKYSENI